MTTEERLAALEQRVAALEKFPQELAEAMERNLNGEKERAS